MNSRINEASLLSWVKVMENSHQAGVRYISNSLCLIQNKILTLCCRTQPGHVDSAVDISNVKGF